MNDPLRQMMENLPAMLLSSTIHFLFIFLMSWPGLVLIFLLVANYLLARYQRFMRRIERMDQPRRRRW